MFYQVGLLPVTNNLLDNSSDIYLIVYGMIRSDRLIIRGLCVIERQIYLIYQMAKEIQFKQNSHDSHSGPF